VVKVVGNSVELYGDIMGSRQAAAVRSIGTTTILSRLVFALRDQYDGSAMLVPLTLQASICANKHVSHPCKFEGETTQCSSQGQPARLDSPSAEGSASQLGPKSRFQ
jgi:hypothetical protein